MVDGIQLSDWDYAEDHSHLFGKLEDALTLIREFDKRRYERLRRDVPRITLRRLQVAALFSAKLKEVVMDVTYVERSSVEELAMTIVHESMHARLDAAHIRVTSINRERVEHLCVAEEKQFGTLLGARAATYVASVEAKLQHRYWDDSARFQRHVNELREAGMPDVLLRWYAALFRP